MKGIVITKMVIILAIIAVAAYLLLAQSGQVPSLSSIKIGQPTTTIKSTQEASTQITDISTNVDDVTSILEDIDNSLG